jgi:uncharacterized membrane protein YgdD (TMEM256/DUF423 family)
MSEQPRSESDAVREPAQALTVLYALFAVAAGTRALYQIAVKWDEAPLAYALSAVAALVYLVACVGLQRRSPAAWRMTLGVCIFELIGVLLVGALTMLEPALFPRATVWSHFGQGYGFVPLVLPILGLMWLLRQDIRRAYGVVKVKSRG